MKLSTSLEKLLFSTIRIETRLSDDTFVDGTAFVYEYSTNDNTYPFLITSRHLIEHASEGRMTLIQGQNRAPILGKGYTLDIDNFSKLWFSHPDEVSNVAVTPFVPFVKHVENSGISIFFEALNKASLCTPEITNNLHIGSDIMYLGYPKNCWDSKHLLGVVRKSILAMPYDLDYQGKRQVLVDAPVIQGSSGSPVFLKTNTLNQSSDNTLLGFLTNLPEPKEQDQSQEILVDNPQLETPMGAMVKIDVAIETIVAYLQEKGFL